MKNWFSEQMRDDLRYAMNAARGFATRINSDGETEYAFSDDLDPALYDSSAIYQAVEQHLQNAELPGDERHLLQTLSNGLKKGKSDSQRAES